MRQAVIISNREENKRIALGIQYIKDVLIKQGYVVTETQEPSNYEDYRELIGEKIYVGDKTSEFISWLTKQEVLVYHLEEPQAEGFYIQSCPGRLTVISGGDDVGALYGCLELSERIDKEGALPYEICYGDAPVFKLRGPVIGLQKTKLEPPRLTYEYPITPDRFPWFYDKQMWSEYLEMMMKNRCNVLYLWSGHPFSSLVKVPGYEEALEVSEEEFQLNKEIFGWLTEECDKRGIWVVLKFYNIHISYPFAIAHNLELLQSNINPLVADYTYKSIVEFIKSYPHIGLMVCLGEALRGTQNKTDWFIKTIIPAVKEGIVQAGITEEPPIILRGHDCDPVAAMNEAQKIYSNLYTMWKYNGESLTTYYPKGNWQKIHQSLSQLGTTHIMNIHILANLEPFRFNAPSYIQKCVQAGQNRLGVNALHLYPLFYWDWPYAPDKTVPRLKQLDRDAIWFAAWFRYAWNPNREEKDEKRYWTEFLSEQFNCPLEGARLLLEGMEAAAQCTPRMLGRIGITEGNRQTLSLGMTMSQLTNVNRYRPNKELWYSVARKGEQPDDFIEKELRGEAHLGETPYDMIEDMRYFSLVAKEKLEKASTYINDENEEFHRIKNDVEAIWFMCNCYCKKLEAAMLILKYKYTMNEKCLGDISLLEAAKPLMEESLNWYRSLANLTKDTYLYANSMQTPQRKIPFPNGETYGHWTACLPEYEKEYQNFCTHLLELKEGKIPGSEEGEEVEIQPLQGCEYNLLSENCKKITLKKGENVFTDCSFKIQNVAPELMELSGVSMGFGEAIEQGVTVKLELLEDSYVLVGYMNGKGVEWLQLPDLETNTHADDRGGLSVVYANALKAESCPPINIHAFRYEKGIHELYFGTGGFMIAGVVPQTQQLKYRNADLAGEGLDTLDWLYE